MPGKVYDPAHAHSEKARNDFKALTNPTSSDYYLLFGNNQRPPPLVGTVCAGHLF